MKQKNYETIKCPNCGYEYLPGEIFVPDALVGQPSEVFRKTEGSIDTFFGTEPCFTEHYMCDKCNHHFDITAKVRFVTTSTKKPKYKTPLVKESFYLDED